MTIFALIGLLCFIAPEAVLDDPAWDVLPNRRFFSYANGLTFLGGAILFFASDDSMVKHRTKIRALLRCLGTTHLLSGIAYVAWSLYHAW